MSVILSAKNVEKLKNENPRGVLRKMPFMKDFIRHTVSYCQYGDNRMKPTDIWTNALFWKPKPICKNGSPCDHLTGNGYWEAYWEAENFCDCCEAQWQSGTPIEQGCPTKRF